MSTTYLFISGKFVFDYVLIEYANNWTNRSFYLISFHLPYNAHLTAFLSGIVCYRLGAFSGCSSPWMANIQATHSSTVDSIHVDIDDPAYFRSSVHLRSTPQTTSIDPHDRRFVARPSTPYKCGVVFFYHIPSTGGASINAWFRKYKKRYNVDYYQWWQQSVKKDGSYHPDPEECERTFNEGVTEHIQNLGPNEWRVAHSHVTSQYLNESEHMLYKWRADVEAQGCEFINTIMLRDPLNHVMSLHKVIKQKNSTREEWTEFLSKPTGMGLWNTMLDFFLYNNHGLRYHDDYPFGPGGRNPYNVTKEEKVRRAMELLHRHFDLVTLGDHKRFSSTLLKWTGWEEIEMPRTNVYKKELEFTKKEIENFVKKLQANGDIEFIDQVKKEYYDYLSYLNR